MQTMLAGCARCGAARHSRRRHSSSTRPGGAAPTREWLVDARKTSKLRNPLASMADAILGAPESGW